jgi:hypothetical protein
MRQLLAARRKEYPNTLHRNEIDLAIFDPRDASQGYRDTMCYKGKALCKSHPRRR